MANYQSKKQVDALNERMRRQQHNEVFYNPANKKLKGRKGQVITADDMETQRLAKAAEKNLYLRVEALELKFTSNAVYLNKRIDSLDTRITNIHERVYKLEELVREFPPNDAKGIHTPPSERALFHVSHEAAKTIYIVENKLQDLADLLKKVREQTNG